MEHVRGLRYGPLTRSAVHLCVDMQRMFDADTPWASGAVGAALPAVREICRYKPASTIFTRFICPADAGAIKGQWARFYAACPELLKLDPRLFDIVPGLQEFTGVAAVYSRFVFSAFQDGTLQAMLRARSADTLVFSGVETDVCVLATVLGAIDIGYRVVIVEEGVASSNEQGHVAAMAGVLPRFDQQIEVVGVADALRDWR
jgi:nicotinamidase-related amidase